MSRRQQLLRPAPAGFPPSVPVFDVQATVPGQLEYLVDMYPGPVPTLYRIQYSTNNDFESDPPPEITTSSTGWQTLPLPPGVTHYLRARAERDGLASIWTPAVQAEVPQLFLEQTGADSESVYLSWPAIAGVSGYLLAVDGGAPTFTTDNWATVPGSTGITQNITLQAFTDTNYGNVTDLTVVGLPVAPDVTLDLGDRGGSPSLEFSVYQDVYFTQFDWSLGYYDGSSSFVEIQGGTFYENDSSFILVDDYPEIYGTTVEFRAVARYIDGSLDLTSDLSYVTYEVVNA